MFNSKIVQVAQLSALACIFIVQTQAKEDKSESSAIQLSNPTNLLIEHVIEQGEDDLDKFMTKEWWMDVAVVAFCLLVSGFMSGLTVGLAAIDRLALEIEAASDPEAKRKSKRIFAVIDNHHWMLVTLLVCNACALETMPLYLDKMVSEVFAIILSVTGVLLFGEVIPMAVCTGPAQVTIAYYSCPIVQCIMYITSPISWPIAKLLDAIMGEHKIHRYANEQLRNLIMLHTKQALKELGDHGPLLNEKMGINETQTKFIKGALEMDQRDISVIGKHISEIFTVSMDDVVTKDTLKLIKKKGYSRVPVCYSQEKQNHIVGYLLTRSLIGVELGDDEKTFYNLFVESEIEIRAPIYTTVNGSLTSLLYIFKSGYSHLAVVCQDAKSAQTQSQYAKDLIEKVKFLELKKHSDNNEVQSEGDNNNLPDVKFDQNDLSCSHILTLEALTEAILQTDILDERDRNGILALEDDTLQKDDIDYTGLSSMRYSDPNDDYTMYSVGKKDAPRRKGIITDYNTKFVKNFTEKMEQLLRENIPKHDEQQKIVGAGSTLNDSLLQMNKINESC